MAEHFGTAEPADVKRLRRLEHESGQPTKLVTDRDLEIDVLKEISRNTRWAHACAGSQSPTRTDAACRAAAGAPC